MALTPIFINGFDVESADRVHRKYSHTPSGFGFTQTNPGYQASSLPGYLGGRAWFIFNTGFQERNFTASLGSDRTSVVFRAFIRATRTGSGAMPNVLFLRFQSGGSHLVNFQWNADNTIRITRDGSGTNANTGGTVVATLPGSLDFDDWADLEIRIDFATSRIRVWRDNASIFDQSGLGLGSSVDRVTMRWEALGTVGMTWDHVAIGYDTAVSNERFGTCRVFPIALLADYSVSSTWTPNGGSAHFDRLTEAVTVLPNVSPNDDLSYLAGDHTSLLELFGVAEPDCIGYNFAVALNLAAKRISGNSTLRHRLLTAEGFLDLTTSPYSTLDTSEYTVHQGLSAENPDTVEAWSDRQIQAAAWGFQPGPPAGDIRVTAAYLEKLTSISGVLPFDCGGGSYIL